MKFALALVAIVILVTGCSKGTNSSRPDWDDSEDVQEITDGHDSAFDEQLKSIAGDYLKYSIVNSQPKFAPTLCMAPPKSPSFSLSDDESSHGQKLYFLFAAKPVEYVTAATKASPVGQTLVKEAWAARKVSSDADELKTYLDHQSGTRCSSNTAHEGDDYVVGAQKDLFIMFKTEATSATDEGWVYGVVTADGSKVLGGGKLKNCMSCHQDAGVDRLFGQQPNR